MKIRLVTCFAIAAMLVVASLFPIQATEFLTSSNELPVTHNNIAHYKYMSPYSFTNVQNHISNNRPIVALQEKRDQHGYVMARHAVVINGWETDGTKQYVLYKDPDYDISESFRSYYMLFVDGGAMGWRWVSSVYSTN